MNCRLQTLCLMAIISGCNKSGATEERSILDSASLTSSLPLGGGAVAAVERTYAGGATGETLHRARICQAELSDCREAAVVDTNDGPPPTLRAVPAGLELVVGPSDTVWSFSNFAYLPEPNKRSKIRLVERPL